MLNGLNGFNSSVWFRFHFFVTVWNHGLNGLPLDYFLKYCFEEPFKPNFEILEKSFNDWKIKKNRMFKFDLNSKLKPDHETTVLNGF